MRSSRHHWQYVSAVAAGLCGLMVLNSQAVAAGTAGACDLMPQKQLGTIFGGDIEMAIPSHMGAELGCMYGGSALHGGGVILHLVTTDALKASGDQHDAASYYAHMTKVFASPGTEMSGVGDKAVWAKDSLFVLAGDTYIQVDFPSMSGDQMPDLARKVATGVIANLGQSRR